MYHSKFWITILLATFSVSLTSQEIIQEFQVTYEVSELDFSDSEDQLRGPVFDMLKSMKILIASNDSFYLSKTYGTVENSWLSFLTDHRSNSTKVYGKIAGSKMYGIVKGEDVEDSLIHLADSVVHHYPLHRKELLGYSTQKVEYTTKMKIKDHPVPNAYYRKKVTAYIIEGAYPAHPLFLETPELKYVQGIPLAYRINGPVFDITFIAKEFKRSVDPEIFEIDEDEFEELSPQNIRDQFPRGF